VVGGLDHLDARHESADCTELPAQRSRSRALTTIENPRSTMIVSSRGGSQAIAVDRGR
jgi:hypothetical protein